MTDLRNAERLRCALRDSSDDLLNYFGRRVENREDAADMLAETALVAWRRLADLPAGDGARLWLFGIASRVVANHRRSRRRYAALVERVRLELRSASVDGSAGPEALAVRDAVDRLQPEHRELVMLVHWDGFTTAEAASILGLNASTARSRYAVARQLLRAALSENASSRC